MLGGAAERQVRVGRLFFPTWQRHWTRIMSHRGQPYFHREQLTQQAL